METSFELPGLFREQPRLLKKLTSQEIRSINDYIQRRVEHQHACLIKRLGDLEMSRDYAEKQHEERVDLIKKESEKDRCLAQKYKHSFENMTQIWANKVVRYEGKYANLLKETADLEKDYRAMRRLKMRLEEEIKNKNSLIGIHREEIHSLKGKMAERANYNELVENSEKMRNEILRIKLDLDLKRKENIALLKDIDRLREGRTQQARKSHENVYLGYQTPSARVRDLVNENVKEVDFYETRSSPLRNKCYRAANSSSSNSAYANFPVSQRSDKLPNLSKRDEYT